MCNEWPVELGYRIFGFWISVNGDDPRIVKCTYEQPPISDSPSFFVRHDPLRKPWTSRYLQITRDEIIELSELTERWYTDTKIARQFDRSEKIPFPR